MIFFFNDTATTEIYTLSLHDALPISPLLAARRRRDDDGERHGPARLQRHELARVRAGRADGVGLFRDDRRSEEHTSELQSRQYLVCRLLLEKKKNTECDDNDAADGCA